MEPLRQTCEVVDFVNIQTAHGGIRSPFFMKVSFDYQTVA